MGARAFRRSAAVAVLALGAVGVTAIVSPAGADEDFVAGSGQVTTRVVKVGPTAGRLSFAPTVGLASANYTGTVGRAESKMFDYGALDGNIPPEFVAQTGSVRVDSTDDGAAKGVSKTSAGLPPESPIHAGGTTQAARAGGDPFGEATFVLGDFAAVPGVVELSGGRAVSRSGVAGKATREAVGTVTIGRLALGGGAVVLEGLRWEVHQRTGKDKGAGGTFSIQGITIGGTKLAPPAADQLAGALQQVNDALKPLGLRLDAPVSNVNGGVAAITPLGIHVQASEPGRAVGAPLLGALQPVRDPIASGIIAASPEAGGLVTLGDVTLGALTGRGGIDLQLGGGSAYTEGERFASPFGSFDLGGGGFGPVSLGGGGTAGSSTPGGDAVPSQPGSTGGAGDKGGPIELAGARHQDGTTGGAAAVVGLVGLLAVLSMAGADWWRLRHEPRRIAL
ncbi:MAG: hypothetical protein JWO68_1813 [Actinomycetia bacterium]|nr:hypothetical protein [Actinomycetes bacterium]